MSGGEPHDTLPHRAARVALDRRAWAEAVDAFEVTLRERQSPEALEGLGCALFWLDRAHESLEVREKAFLLYREAGDVRGAARMAYGLAADSADLRGEAPAEGWLARARRLLEGVDPGPEHGWLALWEGHFALLYRRDPKTARTRSAQALDLARGFGMVDLEMLALALQGLVLVAEGEVQEGMRRLDEATAAALAGEVGALTAVGATCCLLVHACERVRDYDRAAQWGERVRRFSREWGIDPSLAVCRTQHAAMLIGQGQWEEAERELTEASERLSRSRPLLAVEATEQFAELRRRQGRWEEAEELLVRAEGRSLALLSRAALAWDRGEAGSAADLLERFLRRTPLDNWNGRATALELLARTHLCLGRRDDAKAAREDLAALMRRIDAPTIRAAAHLAEGVALTHDGRHAEARPLLEDAVDAFVQARAPYEAARARLDLARCLAALGRAGPARQEARSALESFQKLGAARDAYGAERQARDEAEAPSADPVTASGLTSREAEVLRLVAEGLADKEIADRLHLSGHTVHRHVSNIRTKLGLPSRAAAVAWAARHGVL